jgi:hypothetical protein
MPDKNTRPIKYPIQKRLFDELRMTARQQGKDFMQHYMAVQGLSKTPSYERFAGNIPISFDEGYALLLESQAMQSNTVQLISSAQVSRQVLAALNGFHADNKNTLVLSLQEPPLFYLMHSPIVGCFRLFVAEWSAVKSKGLKPPVFDQAYRERKDVKEALEEHQQVLQSLVKQPSMSRCEIWSQNFVGSLCAVVRWLHSEGALPDTESLKAFKEGLYQFVAELKENAKQHRIWVTPLMLPSSQLLYPSSTEPMFCAWLSIDMALYSRQLQVYSWAAAQLEFLRRCANPLVYNQTAFHQFFDSIQSCLDSNWPRH